MNVNSFDKIAFEKLFKEYFPYLCSFAKKYVDDIDECKDIVHNVYLNLWQKRNELKTDQSLKPYLFQAVHNRCLNYIRDHKKIVRHDVLMEQGEIPDYIESTDYLEQSELENRIKSAIDDLPVKCQKIFRLSRFEDKKYSEIADQLGLSVKAVEAQMSKALKILRLKLADYLVVVLILLWHLIG